MSQPAGSTSQAKDNINGTLPEYSAQSLAPQASSSGRPALCEHVYSLENKGHKWVTLKVKNSRAALPAHLPVYHANDIVEGVVEMDLLKAESSKGVTISITAGTTTIGQDELVFFDTTTDVWAPGPSSSKLKGKYTWPFSITLPKMVEASVEEKGIKTPHPPPPTYAERASPAYVDYRLVVTVKRGFMRVDQTLSTSFAFIPRSIADPPSDLRKAAYSQGHALVGPKADPDGWKMLPPITIKGTLFDTREVEATYTVGIATPLTYAMGSPIPLVCTITCDDAQALDLLSKTSSIGLCFARMLAIGSNAMNVDSAPARTGHNTFLKIMGRAFWWPSEQRPSGETTRELEGELMIQRGIKPSFLFPRVSLGYSLILLPPKAAGFVPAASQGEPLVTERIRITTDNTPGVVPRSFAPPGYVHEEEGDYAVSTVFLETGNQRFLSHHLS